MVTLADVAKHAGVSKTQVSFVLNRKNLHLVSAERRTRISKAIRDLNYRPNQAARRLAGKPSHLLGLLLPGGSVTPYGPLIQGVLSTARLRGYQVIVAPAPTSADALRKYIEHLEPYDLDGMICVARQSMSRVTDLGTLMGRFRRSVVIGPEGITGVTIQADHRTAMRDVVRYLAESGRRNIGLILPEQDESLRTAERLAGVEDATADLGWTRNDELTWKFSRRTHPWPDESEAQAAVDALVVRGGADAIIAHDDAWAARILQTLTLRGHRVPKEISVVGYGNLPFSELTAPSLTTVDLQERRMGLTAVDQLIDAIENDRPTERRETVAVEASLILRDSA
ncbi:LacI family DNA-binding transcriptional regulator [Mucisphaera calidilacus]|nr:LacI family DNA-binding transcriptional regulator [Mucisphaera calidilacus]